MGLSTIIWGVLLWVWVEPSLPRGLNVFLIV